MAMRKLVRLILILLPITVLEANSSATETFDVIVYGGTPAGVMAAHAAHEEGAAVLLIEPTRHVGGIISSGLGGTDHCRKEVVGGAAKRFFERNGKFYNRPIEWRTEPSKAEAIFEELLSGIRVVREARVVKLKATGPRISAVHTQDGQEFSGKVFIDATYEGDLLPLAGVSFTIGREGQAQYGEKLAGVFHTDTRDQFPEGVTGLAKDGTLLPTVLPSGPGRRGDADRKVSAYNFRPCITAKPENRRPFYKPEGYDERQYELLLQYLRVRKTTRFGEMFRFLKVPNGKIDLNNNGPFSTDYIGQNWDYPGAGFEERGAIVKRHEVYTKGLLYFLSNDPRVPNHVRDAAAAHGYCKDEFVDNDNFPYQIYVREGRRMIGEYVMTEADLRTKARKPDPLAMASCPVESHHVQRYRDSQGHLKHEGWVSAPVTPYQIPYRSVVPKKGENVNLFVPVAVSASHIAYTTLRMEPVFMALGESVGVAAAMVATSGAPVQDLPYEILQPKLRERKQVLEFRRRP